MTDIARRVKLRAVIEDPDFDHDGEVGLEVIRLDYAVQVVDTETIGTVFRAEAAHPANLLAQTAVVPRDLALTIDLDAIEDPDVRAAFAEAKEENHG